MAEASTTTNFLTDAAHLLRLAVPETSAYLMSQRNTLLSVSEQVPSDVQKQHVCAACGHILLGDDGSSLSLKSPRTRWKTRAPQKQVLSRVSNSRKRVRCDQCERYSEALLDMPPKAARRKSKQTPVKALSKTETPNLPKQTANASSKKRAKNRKAGLQALLSGQQKQPGAETLKLSDFMR